MEHATLERNPITASAETILLVEDDDPVRRMVRQVLSSRGYIVLDAGDVHTATELCAGHPGPIHLLLTDVIMPHQNGGELAARLKTMRPGLRVLFMSGYTDETIRGHRIQGPGIDFVQKPFSPESLACEIRRLLDDRADPPSTSLR